MQTHRGFMPQLKLRQPSRSLQARALISSRALISAGAIIATLSSCAAMEPTVAAEPGVAFSLPNEVSSGDLQIRLVGLTPIPRQADGNAPRAYVAQLVVNRI